MVFKKLITVLIILTLLFASSSCGDQSNDQSPNQSTENLNLIDDFDQNMIKRDDGPLSIYIYSHDIYLDNAIDQFNSNGEYGVIEPKVFVYDQSGEYQEQLEQGLVSGNGPDIIITSYYNLPHLTKLIQNGTFCDLNEFINADSEFNPGDYYEKALEYGVIAGSRYVMPLSYSINGLIFTTKQIIDENQFSMGSRYISYKDCTNMATSFMNEHAGENKYISDQFGINLSKSMIDLLNHNVHLNSSEAVQFIAQYGDMRKSTYYKSGQAIITDIEFYSRLPEGVISFMFGNINGLDDLPQYYKRFKTEITPEIYAVNYTKEVNTASAMPKILAAINTNCENKKAAYEFIKLTMTEEIQRYVSPGLPVNKAAYEDQKETFINNPRQSILITQGSASDPTIIGGIRESETAEYIVNQMDDIVNGNLSFNLIDTETSSIIGREVLALYQGTKTFEEAAESMQKNVLAYLDGNISDYIQKPAATPQGIPVLSIQYLDNEWSIKNAINSFSEKRQDVKIEDTVYPDSSRDEYITKLTTSVMAGEGPDIICFDRLMFNSLGKTVSTGVFCDLNELIAKDETFKNLDLNEKVLESGIFNGKRYYIPLRYDLPLLLTTKSLLDQNGIRIDETNWSLDEFKKIIQDYVKNSGNKYFFDSYFSFSVLVNGCGVNFIDYETKKANFQSDEFIDLIKFYKDIYPYIVPVDSGMNSDIPEVLLRNHDILMNFDFLQSPDGLWSTNSIYSEILGEEPLIYPLPTIEQDAGIPVEVMYGVSINQNCENKQAALDFIEELLSENIQRANDQNGNPNIIVGFPVNNKAFLEELEYYMSPSAAGSIISLSSGSTSREFASVSLPEDIASRITELNNRTCKGPEIDQVVYAIIKDGLHKYLDGKQTAEEAARDINNKVNLFLNE